MQKLRPAGDYRVGYLDRIIEAAEGEFPSAESGKGAGLDRVIRWREALVGIG